MPPKKKACLKQDGDVCGVIQAYLEKQYKPFAINDIVSNLQKDYKFSKPVVLKALDTLVDEGRIVSKPFGKVTIYCCKEQDLELPKGVDVNEVTYDLISELREELRLLEKEKSTLLEKKNALFSEPENDKLLDVLATLRESERDIDAKLDDLERNWDPTNQKEINELKNLEKNLKKDLASRKKLINDLLAIIKESGLLKKGETMAELLVCVMEIKSIFYLLLFILISLFFIDSILTKQNFI